MRFRFGECILDEDTRDLLRGGVAVHLTPKAFKLLAILLRERPRAVSKAELQERLWPATFVAESNLPSLIREIRTAIDEVGRNAVHLRTIHGFGYAFSGTAEETSSHTAAVRSIVILPFENPSGSAEIAYIADGIVEGVINTVSRVPDLRVTPRATAFRLAAWASDFNELRKRLGTRWVVTGRVTTAGGEVGVQFDVIEAVSSRQIWGASLRKRMSDIGALEGEIADQIVAALSPPRSVATPPPAETHDGQAYLLNLKGRHHWNRRTSASLRRAVECFREAAHLDPRYAAPHVGLAEAYIAIGTRDLLDPREAFAEAQSHAEAALAIDPASLEAEASLAAIEELHRWDWSAAEARHLRAIEHHPDDGTARQWYALHLSRRGRHDEARRHIEKAASLDPLSLIIGTNRGLVSYLHRDYMTALTVFDDVLELDPNYEDALLAKALTIDLLERRSDAWSLYDRLLAAAPEAPHVLAFYAHSLALAGRRERCEELFHTIEQLRGRGFISGVCCALPLLGMGDIDAAFDWLHVAADQRSAWMVYLFTEPRLDPLRGDPRFAKLLTRINLPSPASGSYDAAPVA